jgi:hypothetical protein
MSAYAEGCALKAGVENVTASKLEAKSFCDLVILRSCLGWS